MTPDLWTLIDSYFKAREAWQATTKQCDNDDEFEALCAAEVAVLQHRCGSMEELSHKATFIIGFDSMLDSFRQDRTEGGDAYSVVFLRSLIIEEAL